MEKVGEREEAIASYRRATEIKPDFADAYFALGLAMEKVGEAEEEEAIANYRKAIDVKSNFVGALSLREYEEAIALYKSALAEDSKHVNSVASLGWCFLKWTS